LDTDISEVISKEVGRPVVDVAEEVKFKPFDLGSTWCVAAEVDGNVVLGDLLLRDTAL
jgi:hypothetical protein